VTDHDSLIEALSRSAKPVNRPWPAAVRATACAAAALGAGWLAAGAVPMSWTNLNGAGPFWGALELAMTAILGLAALLQAFEMSIAGRSPRGLPWVKGCLLAWLGASFAGIMLEAAPASAPGDRLYCFPFLLGAGIPMMLPVILALRRTRTLQPGRTSLVAGLGIAALAASLLAVCHPFALSMVDFAMHLAGMASIVLLMVGIGQRWIAVRP